MKSDFIRRFDLDLLDCSKEGCLDSGTGKPSPISTYFLIAHADTACGVDKLLSVIWQEFP